MKRFIIIFLLLVLLPVLCFSEEEEEEKGYVQLLEELFTTESVYPQEKGEIQFSIMSIYNKAEFSKSYNFPLTIEYGITDSWQLEMELNSFKHGSDFKFDVIELGTKYAFMNIAGIQLHSAIGFEIGIPLQSSSSDDEESGPEYEPYLILAKDFPRLNNLQLFTQLKLEMEDSFEEIGFGWNIGVIVPLGKMCIVSEFSYLSGEEKEIYITPGLVWSLPGNWELMAGCPIGLSDYSDKFRIMLGITYEVDTD